MRAVNRPSQVYAERAGRLAHRGYNPPPVKQNPRVTGLLLAWAGGDADAPGELVSAVYDELRRKARRLLRNEGPGHSLAPTALVHETYLKLVDQRRVEWRNRAHFYAIAARLMRRVLVDHARARLADKRGGWATRVPIDGIDVSAAAAGVDVLALDESLQRLGMLEPRQVHLVELRFFGGLSIEEAAGALNVSPATAKRDWTAARAWLYRDLRGTHHDAR